jgi:hypothetical protein
VTIPDFPAFLFRDEMLGVPGESLDRLEILPINDRDAGPVRVSGRLDADISFLAFGNFHHALIHFGMLRMIDVGID